MITPMIFGAQRFSLSSGLGIDKSPMQDAVAGSMSWMSGDVAIWSAGSSGGSEANSGDVQGCIYKDLCIYPRGHAAEETPTAAPSALKTGAVRVPVSDIKLDDEVLLGLVAILVGPLAARGARADHHHDAVGIALGIVRIA